MSNLSFKTFSGNEVEAGFKEEFLEFLEKDISEMRHEIIVLNEQLMTQSNFSKDDFFSVYAQIVQLCIDIRKFNKFTLKYFKTSLVNNKTRNDIEMHISISEKFAKIVEHFFS